MEIITLFIELTKKICALNAYYDNQIVCMYVSTDRKIKNENFLKIATSIIESIALLSDHKELNVLRNQNKKDFDEVIRILNDVNILKIFYAFTKGHLGVLDLRDKLFVNGERFF